MFKKINKIVILLLTGIISLPAWAQPKIESIPYGNMDQWMSRKIEESFVIGGETKTIYEIADKDLQIAQNTPYRNTQSPWAVSSVYARVHGITKASVTVFPERRGKGYAERLETKIEHVKVFGIINIYVLASGTIFLGQMVEPITSTDNPHSNLITGIPFTKQPKALQYDYKVVTGGPSRKVNGFTDGEPTGTTDHAEVFILLQKRWEDAQGSVHALRIGTGWEKLTQTETSWQNKHQLKIHYGDITGKPFYKSYMALKKGSNANYTKNSKGKMVPIIEEGWGTKADGVTHLILQFSSSDGGPYIGNTHSKLWVDNVALVY
ncbi:MAG TPA: PCMD domain-containing protein [Chitinophagaceae bacterium]|nr:PCMD domain-containing protein [Chitinophagaceae bacterium]